MKKILLVCDLGMSTSLMVKKMQEAAKNQGIEVEICAKSVRDYKTCVAEFDVALLGLRSAINYLNAKKLPKSMANLSPAST